MKYIQENGKMSATNIEIVKEEKMTITINVKQYDENKLDKKTCKLNKKNRYSSKKNECITESEFEDDAQRFATYQKNIKQDNQGGIVKHFTLEKYNGRMKQTK